MGISVTPPVPNIINNDLTVTYRIVIFLVPCHLWQVLYDVTDKPVEATIVLYFTMRIL